MQLKLFFSEDVNPIAAKKIVSFIASIQKQNREIHWSVDSDCCFSRVREIKKCA
jgi:hypothetical protein